MIRLVVFDLDGTLVDSSHDLAEATNALLAELGGAPLALDAVVSMVGEGAAVLVKRALERSGLDPEMPGALARFLELYDERLLNATRPYPGMIEAIATLGAKFSPGGADEQAGTANARDLERPTNAAVL